jgi:hypothetical protein
MNKPIKKQLMRILKRIWKGIKEGFEEMGEIIYNSGFTYPPFM